MTNSKISSLFDHYNDFFTSPTVVFQLRSNLSFVKNCIRKEIGENSSSRSEGSFISHHEAVVPELQSNFVSSDLKKNKQFFSARKKRPINELFMDYLLKED